MPFYYGSYDWDTIISTIANDLEDTGDWEIYDNQVANGVALRHVPSNKYLTIRKKALIEPGRGWRIAGIQVVLSSAFDSNNHIPSGTIKHASGPLYWALFHNDHPGEVNYYLTNFMGSDDQYNIWMWTDKRGFLIVVTNPFSYDPLGTNDATHGFFMNVEVIPVNKREYNDGLGDFFMFAFKNDLGFADWNNYGVDYIQYYARDLSLSTARRLVDRPVDGTMEGAIRSLGSGKVYFTSPSYYNDLQNTTLSAQTRRWFWVSKDRGLAINDIINWIDPDEGVTRQFVVAQCTATGIGANTSSFLVAIPYSNACTYD